MLRQRPDKLVTKVGINDLHSHMNNVPDLAVPTDRHAAVFDELSNEIGKALAKRGPGMFSIPGLCKIVVQHKPATKERMGINPFTKEEQVFKAKPARNVVKVRPLKNLKDMA